MPPFHTRKRRWRPTSSRACSGRCGHAREGSSFYRARLDAAGVGPEDIRCLDDLAKLPFITADDLRDDYPFPLRSVPFEQIVRIHSSVGHHGQAEDPLLHPEGRGRLGALLRPLLRDGRGDPAGSRADRRGLRPVDGRGGLSGRGRAGRGHGCPHRAGEPRPAVRVPGGPAVHGVLLHRLHGAPAGRGGPQAGPGREDQPQEGHLRLGVLVACPCARRSPSFWEAWSCSTSRGSPSSTARARGSSARTTTASITGPTTTSWRSSTPRP